MYYEIHFWNFLLIWQENCRLQADCIVIMFQLKHPMFQWYHSPKQGDNGQALPLLPITPITRPLAIQMKIGSHRDSGSLEGSSISFSKESSFSLSIMVRQSIYTEAKMTQVLATKQVSFSKYTAICSPLTKLIFHWHLSTTTTEHPVLSLSVCHTIMLFFFFLHWKRLKNWEVHNSQDIIFVAS